MSSVIAAEAWPSIFCTALTFAPGRVTSLGLARDQNHPASSPRGYEPYV
jgi:hypothetical protein